MAEPIRKPVHRPRPPHPHAHPRPVPIRSRPLLEDDPDKTIQPRPAPPVRPALVPSPERAAQTAPQPATEPAAPQPAAFVPPDEPLAAPRVPEVRSGRSFLLAALALHLGVLLAAWFGPPAPDLGPADLLLSGVVLLSGGAMLVLGSRRG